MGYTLTLSQTSVFPSNIIQEHNKTSDTIIPIMSVFQYEKWVLPPAHKEKEQSIADTITLNLMKNITTETTIEKHVNNVYVLMLCL